MATIHHFTNSPARAPARAADSPTRAPVTSTVDVYEYFGFDAPAPHRGFAVLIGAACSWLAVFCLAYFAAEMARVWL